MRGEVDMGDHARRELISSDLHILGGPWGCGLAVVGIVLLLVWSCWCGVVDVVAFLFGVATLLL